jgi:hypothetical protein
VDAPSWARLLSHVQCTLQMRTTTSVLSICYVHGLSFIIVLLISQSGPLYTFCCIQQHEVQVKVEDGEYLFGARVKDVIAADDLADALIGNMYGMYLLDVDNGEDGPHAVSALVRIRC